jgi:hypothetical protein
MKIDLLPNIQRDIEIVSLALDKTKLWQKEDIAYFSCKVSDFKMLSITIFPYILYYKENSCNLAVPWLALDIGNDKMFDNDTINFILNNLVEIQMRPFCDDDSYHRYFTYPIVEEDIITKITCFINPNYPEGYRNNHVIPYKIYR